MLEKIAAYASIAGLLIAAIGYRAQLNTIAWIGIGLTVLFLLLPFFIASAFTAFGLTKGHFEKYDAGVNIIAIFSEYRNTGGNEGVYETTRFVQSKMPWKNTISHKFFWYGDKPPLRVESELHTVSLERAAKNGSEHCVVNLGLNRPLVYNESTVLHLLTSVDVTSDNSPTFVGTRVKEPMDVIELSAVLTRPEERPKADVLKRPIGAQDWEHITSIEFDKKTSSYRWWQPHPTPGYEYRLNYKMRN